MKRRILLFATAILLAGALALVLLNRPQVDIHLATTQFESTALPVVVAPPKPPPPPKAKYSRTVWAQTTLASILPALDRCRGPVAADLGGSNPVYVAEHDYCGGSAWMWNLDPKDHVALDGKGVDDGLYVVTKLKYFPRKSGADVADLPAGDVVLQTCVSKTEMVFIALQKYEVIG